MGNISLISGTLRGLQACPTAHGRWLTWPTPGADGLVAQTMVHWKNHPPSSSAVHLSPIPFSLDIDFEGGHKPGLESVSSVVGREGVLTYTVLLLVELQTHTYHYLSLMPLAVVALVLGLRNVRSAMECLAMLHLNEQKSGTLNWCPFLRVNLETSYETNLDKQSSSKLLKDLCLFCKSHIWMYLLATSSSGLVTSSDALLLIASCS